MSMSTYYLKADTAEQLQDALQSAGLCIENEENEILFYGQAGDFILDWIGEIYEPTGATLDEGTENERPEMVSVGGHHCNVYSQYALPAVLSQYALTAPASPVRKLAGS